MSRTRGFSLAELMVALLIAGIIGVSLAKLVISQARFVSTQDGMLQARSGARAALSVMGDELRSVSDSGLIAASKDSIVVRVPFAYGLACSSSALPSGIVVGLLPADSASYADATSSPSATGSAVRDSVTGAWHPHDNWALATGAPTTTCSNATPKVRLLPTASLWSRQAVYAQTSSTAPSWGTPMYFYQKVTYVFAASVDLPGRRSLWRAIPGRSLREEIVVPFDTSARFQFLVGPSLSVRSTPPALLDSVYGVRVLLVAASTQTPSGRSAPMKFNLTTNLVFRNRAQ